MLDEQQAKRHPQQRSGALDFLRVVGITAVVAGHVAAWAGPATRDTIYPWHVPLFFFLSGYLWSGRRNLGAEFKNRAKSLLIPYFFWLIPVAAFWFWQTKIINPGAFKTLLLGGYYLRGPFAAFWFVTALFAAVVLLRLIQGIPVVWQWAAAVGALVVTYFASDWVAKIPLAVGIGCACLVFVIAGREFRKVRYRFKRPVLTGILLLLISATVIGAGWSTFLDLKYAKFGVPIVTVIVAVAICAGMVLVAEGLVPLAGQRLNAGVSTLASCGLMVVLTHAVAQAVFNRFDADPGLVFAGSLLAPWLMALLVLRTPLAPLMLGTPRIDKTGPKTTAGSLIATK
ncbi:hypothetical protein SRABI83_00513 [Arthrobacter sp. Bi83]|uniref:acyltransferase family protein n=1 Tax=Arthrobacter sp. Bi83 TaxID=2822353 RepID=UPI001D64AAB9|nr:acyltransferase family protein [Arthrobacter sp. Bi83]CAH0142753.1 hypothetical protein SRABI83_00513 [Arthrobacter sp. Bi83]